jgi:allophanate hydrolase
VFARSVEEADVAVRLMAGPDASDPWSRLPPRARSEPIGPIRIGGLDVGVDVDLEPFLAAGELLYGGAFVAERYEAVGAFVEDHRNEVDDVVAEIVLAAGRLPAWQLARDRTALERLRRRTETTWTEIDVLVVPTVTGIPTVAEVLAEPIARNSELGRYTAFVNLLDLCALTVPVEPPGPDKPPASVTLIAPAWSDGLLVRAADRVRRDRPAIHRTA